MTTCSVGLASLLTLQNYYGECRLAAPWRDVVKQWRWARDLPAVHGPAIDQEELRALWRVVIRYGLGDANSVAVAYSGGLDSTAVLCAVLEVVPADMPVLAVSADLPELNVSQINNTLTAVQRHYGRTVDHAFTSVRAPCPWSPAGPSLLAIPEICAGLSGFAQERGA